MQNIEIMLFNPEIVDVKHKIDENNYSFNMHVHSVYEIYLSMSDNNKFCIGQNIHDVNRYDLFLFNNTDIHKINTEQCTRYDRYVVMFSPNIFTKASEETKGLLRCFNANNMNRRHKYSLPEAMRQEFISTLDKMVSSSDPHKNLKLRTYLTELLLMIDNMSQSTHLELSSQSYSNPRIKEISEYIQMNFAYPISLDQLSKQFYLNKFYLCKLFKEQTGFGINEYICACRLNKAVALLNAGETVSTVALKTGFGSDTYFISTFKKNLGVSPKQYIKNCKTLLSE